MNKDLRSIQAPLKEKYKENPDSAVITLHAEGTLGEGVTCNVDTGRKLAAIAGLHPASGGTGMELCSGDMLLEALAACAGVTMKAVASAIGVEIREGKIIAEGDLDFRGTLAVSKEAMVGFKNIRLNYELDSDATEEQLQSLLKLTERYCVVYQTLKSSPELNVSYSLKSESGR
jgi:uncharacterized OsmC-like protein